MTLVAHDLSANRRLLSILGAIALTCVVVIVGVIVWSAWLDRSRSEFANRDALLTGQLIQFERAAGYGGFIHNFKNFILRPDEPRYLVAARANLAEALAILDEMDRLVLDLANEPEGTAVDTTPTRETLLRYGKMIDVAERAAADGLGAREIDAMVRVPDDHAIENVGILVASAQHYLESQGDRIEAEITTLWVLVVIIVVFALALAAFAYDRRQRRGFTARIAQRNTELEEFTRIAAHDLRSPLQQIRAVTGIMKDDFQDGGGRLPDDAMDNLDLIDSRAGKLGRLVDETLSYLRLGNTEAEREPIDLAATVRDIAAMTLPGDATIACHGNGTTVHCNRVEMEIVLRNLLGNAVKHGPGHGLAVVVRSQRVPGGWKIEVEDNGPGIPERHRESVFAMFRALDVGDGADVSGVGLAVVRRLVRGWGGDVTIADASPHGAIFVIAMPRRWIVFRLS